MPTQTWRLHANVWGRFSVKIPTPDSCPSESGLDETLSLSIKLKSFPVSCPLVCNVMCDNFGLPMGEDSGLGERLSHFEWYRGNIAYCIHSFKFGFERMAIHSDPAIFRQKPSVFYSFGGAVRGNIEEKIKVCSHAI